MPDLRLGFMAALHGLAKFLGLIMSIYNLLPQLVFL